MRKPKRTLAIETATEACSVALFEGDTILASEHVVLGRGHAERLVPMIEALPQKGRADRILVSLGPGSFTGVRIGIATARALGFAWDVEVLGYPTLALVAAMAKGRSENDQLTVCVNGGHGEWFVQNFTNGFPTDEVGSLNPASAVEAAKHRVLVGNRSEELAAMFAGQEKTAVVHLPNAAEALSIDKALFVKEISPIYGRGPDAKLPVS